MVLNKKWQKVLILKILILKVLILEILILKVFILKVLILKACTASFICFVLALCEAEVLSKVGISEAEVLPKVGKSFARGEARTVIAATDLQMSKLICHNRKGYFSKLQNVFVHRQNVIVQFAKCI